MIHVIGIGLDGVAGLTEPVRHIIESANLLVGSDRQLSYFPLHPAERLVIEDIGLTFKTLCRQLIRWNSSSLESPATPTLVVLTSGDPLFFGLGQLLLAELPADQIDFHPHLSCIQLAFSRIKVPWQDARIVTAHGRTLDELLTVLREGVSKVAILTNGQNSPSTIARLLLSLDLPSRYDFWVCENLGGSDERIQIFPVQQSDDIIALESQNFSSLNVVVLVRQLGHLPERLEIQNLPTFGLPDSTFLTFSDRPGLMTKREIRILILGELGLQSGQIVWDIGAGTGSVSIEIGRLFPKSQIYAIEKTGAGISLIEQNCQRLHVRNVISIHGIAPDILDRLPVPQRIFIGGTGGQLRTILGFCGGQLAKGGTMAIALATLEHLNEALNWVNERQWDYRILQANLSRSVPIAHLTQFFPLNPVTILTINKPEF
ncbi:precorrin-6y C5,15-methyltransferase (decarboxylating) subunit CbiE [Laspinema palackyanum]|uniref:precorrin-6y C5,15-methyltransferase (decarboxylating) subunit CbiE n=1 Tax=Laspinema palackyanum TaxID=3231601 RepID=UPI00345C74D7|nr:precorrin-6y C5,15-methyltransferase (decarboxylating) subunit CbiE [Laspinema sp. D2c]